MSQTVRTVPHDFVIDQAARAMTDVEPSAGFRARVLADLSARPTPRGWRRPALGLIAVAATLVTLWLPRRGDLPLVPAPRTAESVSSASAPGRPPSNVRPAAGRMTAPKRDVMSAEEAAWHARAVPSLTPPAPLLLSPIQPDTASIAPIIVEALETPPLEIAPLDTRASGRH